MNEEELSAKFRRASREGREAFHNGKRVEDCPYTRKTFGMKSFWLLGFRLAELESSSEEVATQ